MLATRRLRDLTRAAPVRNRRGFALESTLIVLLLMSALAVIAFAGAVTDIRTTNVDYRTTRVSYAAQAGAEAVMAQLETQMSDGLLTDAELAALTQPTIPGFTVDSFKVTKVGGVVVETVSDGPFTGLYALTQRMEIFSRARDAINHTSAAIVSVTAQTIPLFQFGVFFEKDLESTNAPPMTFAGWVHSNGNIYLSSNNAWYKNQITTPNKLFHDKKYTHTILNGVYVADASGTDVLLDFDSRTKPNPADFRAASDASFDNRVKTDAYGLDSLRVPLPLGMDPVEVLRPREMGDTPEEQEIKFAWRADWYMEVRLDQITDPGTTLCPVVLQSRATGKVVPTLGECKQVFSWTWEAFFDARELRYVDVFEINIDNLSNWGKANLTTQNTQVLYVTFIGLGSMSSNPQNDPTGDGFFPAVRLVKGKEIKSGVGLTIATDRPVYIQGDYNSDPSKWVPAAVIADAWAVLSNAWDDAKAQCNNYVIPAPTIAASCTGWTIPIPTPTSVYAAILAGHSPTPCDHEDVGCAGGFFGGGLENFPHHLEKWSGVKYTYRGSLVSLHWTVYRQGQFSSAGAYYKPPDRDWQFDTRFWDPAKLPPATPAVGSIVHTAFRPVY